MAINSSLSSSKTSVPGQGVVGFPPQLVAEKRQLRRKVIVLFLLALISCSLYVFYQFPDFGGFIMKHRLQAVGAIAVTGAALATATMIFQTMVNNRIITPSVLGLDSLYMLIQVSILYFFGEKTIEAMNAYQLFFLSLISLLTFSLLLFKVLFLRENNNIYYVLLLGLVFGTFFRASTTFMSNLLDPGLFFAVMNVGFASFIHINTNLLALAAIIVIPLIFLTMALVQKLNVIALGRDEAVNLGINYQKFTFYLLLIVVTLVAVSTSLVGPITFLGLLVMNLTLEYMRTNRYQYLIPGAIFLSMTILVAGHFIVDKLLSANSTVSIVINFVGGLYFLFLLFKEQKSW